MSNRLNYFFLNYQGICSPPNYQEVTGSDLSRKPFILIPDNNVCTHVSEYSQDQQNKQDEIKKAKVKNFLNYCRTSNITIIPDYGLLERASKPGTLELNKDKLIDCEDAFWRKLGHYSHNDTVSSIVKTIEPLKALLYPHYAYLLMIKLILVKRRTSRANAEINVQDLYEFINEIGIVLALPWQYALAVFGGNTELNTFIKPKRGKTTFDALWGAAWDLFYLQLIHEHNGIRNKGNKYYPQFILVTDDKACSTIGDFAKVTSAFDYGDIIYDGVTMNSEFPHFNHISSFLDEIASDINRDVHQRAHQRSVNWESMSESERENDAKEIMNRVELLVLELTRKLRISKKKGFG